MYDPTYNEMYTLERKRDVTRVSKPVWLTQPNDPEPAHGATVSAELKKGVLSEPELKLMPGFENSKPPTWEKNKLKRLETAVCGSPEANVSMIGLAPERKPAR